MRQWALLWPMMMHLLVENVNDWYQQLSEQKVAEKFGVQVSEPTDQPRAMRDFVVIDPSGVLWRIAQNITV